MHGVIKSSLSDSGLTSRTERRISRTMNENLIAFLNSPLLASEYAAIQQYEFHKAIADNLNLKAYSSYLDERIADERKHAKVLRDRILELEGSPIVEPSKINTEDYLPDQLEVDGAAEETAISDYSEGIKLAVEAGDEATAIVLRGNLSDEVDHLRDIRANQAQVKLVGVENWITVQIG